MVMRANSAELSQLTLPALVELGEYALLRGVSSFLAWVVVLVVPLHLVPATHATVHLLVNNTLQNKSYMTES